jgi:PTS system fructose-specific IIC component
MAKIVAVTSCITGIAHTYMAAEAIERAGKKMGHDVVVETQGSAGLSPVSQDKIDAADAVLFAVDLEVNGRDRFAGKPYLEIPVAKAMNGADAIITKLLESVANGSASIVGKSSAQAEKPVKEEQAGDKKGFLGGLFGKR